MKHMKVLNIIENGHTLMNETIVDTAKIIKEGQFIIKLDDALKERGITQKQLAEMTGLREGTISEIVNGKGVSLNKVQLFAIMAALRISNLSELIELRLPEELENKFKYQSTEWKEYKEMPPEVRDMYRKNVLKHSGLL